MQSALQTMLILWYSEWMMSGLLIIPFNQSPFQANILFKKGYLIKLIYHLSSDNSKKKK